MRFMPYLVLAGSVLALTACGGADQQAADTTTPDTAAIAAAPSPTPAGAAVAMAPITGTTHQIRMVGDDKGYRFEPANISIRSGDGIRFVNVSGGPHNVAFDPATAPVAGKAQLVANMPDQTSGELSSKMFTTANETYTVSFANVAPGSYPYHCTPHLAMGMKGTITIQ